MDKNQAELVVNGYIFNYLPEAKRELEEIKKITDPQEKYTKADASHNNHSYYCTHARGLSNVHNLNISSVYEYEQIVNELYQIKHEALKKKQGSQCLFCKRDNLTNPLIHERDNYGYSKVFCNSECLSKYLQLQNLLEEKAKEEANKKKSEARIKKLQGILEKPDQPTSNITCSKCSRSFNSDYWNFPDTNNQELANCKFCSSECSRNYAKELKNKKLKKIKEIDDRLEKLYNQEREREQFSKNPLVISATVLFTAFIIIFFLVKRKKK